MVSQDNRNVYLYLLNSLNLIWFFLLNERFKIYISPIVLFGYSTSIIV